MGKELKNVLTDWTVLDVHGDGTIRVHGTAMFDQAEAGVRANDILVTSHVVRMKYEQGAIRVETKNSIYLLKIPGVVS